MCYQHKNGHHPPDKQVPTKVQRNLDVLVKPLTATEIYRYIVPVMMPSDLPPRDTTDQDVFVFERVVEHSNSFEDVRNLCMASKRFMEHSKNESFLNVLRITIMTMFNVDMAKLSPYFILRAFGFHTNVIPNPMRMFQMLKTPSKHITYYTRKRKTINLLVSGDVLFKIGIYHLQPINSVQGPGYFCGISEDGYMWFHLDKDRKDGNVVSQPVSFWKSVKTVEDAGKNRIEFL